MEMKLSELVSTVNSLLDEDGVRRTEQTVVDTINGGYWTTAVLTQACERTHSLRATASSLISTLPEDFYTAVSVYYGTARLYPVRLADLDDVSAGWASTVASTPVYYTTLGALTPTPQLWLYPPPSTTGTIRMTYVSVPAGLSSDADVPLFPREHHYVLVWWAYAWELLKERSPILANKSFQVYARYLEEAAMLQQYVYRRTPDRDWLSPPLDSDAVRRKLVSMESPLPQTAGTETQALQQ